MNVNSMFAGRDRYIKWKPHRRGFGDGFSIKGNGGERGDPIEPETAVGWRNEARREDCVSLVAMGDRRRSPARYSLSH